MRVTTFLRHVILLFVASLNVSYFSTLFSECVVLFHIILWMCRIFPHYSMNVSYFFTLFYECVVFCHIILWMCRIIPHYSMNVSYFSTLFYECVVFFHIILWMCLIFPHYLIKGMIFGKEVFEHKICVSIISTNVVRNIFHCKVNSTWCYHKCT